MMSIKVYEEMVAKIHDAALINESLNDIEKEASSISGDEFFNKMKEKYTGYKN